MRARSVHANSIARDWRRLSGFDEGVFGCEPVPPERGSPGDDLAARGTPVGEVVVVTKPDGARVEWCYVFDPEGNMTEIQSPADGDAQGGGARPTPRPIHRLQGHAHQDLLHPIDRRGRDRHEARSERARLRERGALRAERTRRRADSTDREALEALFRRWREALEGRDFAALYEMLTPDARGGNAVFGLMEGRDGVIRFMEQRWMEAVPNVSVWHVAEGARLVNEWKETLPCGSPSGDGYDYFGISELLASPCGRWSHMYGLPDVTGLMRVHARWRADGHAERHPEVYPELG